MKKIYTVLALGLMVGCSLTVTAEEKPVADLHSITPRSIPQTAKQAFLNRVKEADNTLVTETPNGEFNDKLSWNSGSTREYYGSATEGDVNQRYVAVVQDGTDFYIKNPFSYYRTDTWLKGTIDDNGKVTIPTPQLIYVDEWMGTTSRYYATRMVRGVAPDDYTVVFNIDEEETDLHFQYKNGVLVQLDDDVLIGMTAENGEWMYYGDLNVVCDKFDTPVTAPSNIDALDVKMYSFSYNVQGTPGMRIVEMGFDGNDVWLHNYTDVCEDNWIHGVMEGDKITFDSKQFIGHLNSEDVLEPQSLLWFWGATTEAIYYESIKRWGYNHTLQDNLVFTKGENDVWATENTMIVNRGDVGYMKYTEIMEPSLTPYEENVAVPATPSIIDYSQYKEADYCGFVRFEMKPQSVEGNYLNPYKLYYNLFLDTAKEPYSLTQSSYPLFPMESLTDIPYEFSDGTAIYKSGDYRTFVFYPQGLTQIGVQACYTGGGELKKSLISWVNLDTGETFQNNGNVGVEGIQDINDEAEAVYDLNGRRVINPERGIFVVKTASGKTYKKVIK